MKELIRSSLCEAQVTLQNYLSLPDTVPSIEKAVKIMSSALREGKKIISCGNGGSLCDATHFAEELTARYRKNRRALPAIAINDPAYITCVLNDYGPDEIFSRFIEANGNEGDVLLAFSTSGNSKNVIGAVEAAHQKKMPVIGMTRTGGNQLALLADLVIGVPHPAYADRIQEMHILTVHVMIEGIEYELSLNKSYDGK
ncbi:MAG: SIS domain-containing protein [Tannerella sp.]|jgi:D-sedoheptulose 7-phosphate isomerase|nr:SIS domain-containing protein [Tannerella sp.]